jgi:phage baseplate assembly protein W
MARQSFIGFSTYNRIRPPFTLTDIELVKQDLLNHFLTRKGERAMRPGYGSITHELLYEPFDDITREQIIDDTREIIESEPRVNFIDMNVSETDHGINLAIQLEFLPSYTVDELFVKFNRNNKDQV